MSATRSSDTAVHVLRSAVQNCADSATRCPALWLLEHDRRALCRVQSGVLLAHCLYTQDLQGYVCIAQGSTEHRNFGVTASVTWLPAEPRSSQMGLTAATLSSTAVAVWSMQYGPSASCMDQVFETQCHCYLICI